MNLTLWLGPLDPFYYCYCYCSYYPFLPGGQLKTYRKCPWTWFSSHGWLSNILFYNTSISKRDINILIILPLMPEKWRKAGQCSLSSDGEADPLGIFTGMMPTEGTCTLLTCSLLWASASLTSGLGMGMSTHVHKLCFGLFHHNSLTLLICTFKWWK